MCLVDDEYFDDEDFDDEYDDDGDFGDELGDYDDDDDAEYYFDDDEEFDDGNDEPFMVFCFFVCINSFGSLCCLR